MILTFFCRLTADFSLYFSFANCALLFFSPDYIAYYWWPIASLLAAGVLSYGIKRKTRSKSIAAAPLLLPVLIPILLPGWLPLLITVPPWVYLIYILYLDLEQLSHTDYHDRFFQGLKIFPLLALPLLFSMKPGILYLFQTRILPYIVFYMFCCILSLRLNRYQTEALQKPSTQLANFFLLAGFTLVCLSVVYSNIWYLIGQSVMFLYRLIFAPILLLLALAITLPFFALGMLIKLLAGEPQTDDTLIPAELGEMIDYGIENYSSLEIPAFLRYAGIVLLAAGVLYIIWRLFRRLAYRSAHKAQEKAVIEGRQKLESKSGREIDLLPPSDPRQAVRYYYRRFLRQCRKHGIPVGANRTSRDIASAAAGFIRKGEDAHVVGDLLLSENVPPDTPHREEALAALIGLRELYLPARYGDDAYATIEKSAATEAKNAYHIIAKALSHRSDI
ncbi:MAG: hypothetical protein LBH09_08640 [Peptococcaceae bacterium]|nr:hypothetical protein [Peptococcaceae bacterium]